MCNIFAEEKEANVWEQQMDHTRRNYEKNLKTQQSPFDGKICTNVKLYCLKLN